MANKAQIDLNRKLRLEAQLRPKLKKYNRSLVNQVANTYSSTGVLTDTSIFNDELAALLNNHYHSTSRTFSHTLSSRLPQDVGETSEERAKIASALSTFFLFESSIHAQLINDTTAEDAKNSLAEVASIDGFDLMPLAEKSIFFGAALSRKLNSRVSSIIMTETQVAAETAKSTEAEVLSGLNPSVDGGDTRPTEVKKEWVTVGDSRVRESHISADSTRVLANDNFLVGGEPLRWPGDMSQGASLGNVINCRCAAVYDDGRIISERRRRGQAPVLETTLTPQLVESIG